MPAKGDARTSEGKRLHGGCRFSPSCLTCPLPRCKHEMTPSEIGKYEHRALQARIIEAFARNRNANPGMAEFWVEWLTAHEIGVSKRIVELTRARQT